MKAEEAWLGGLELQLHFRPTRVCRQGASHAHSSAFLRAPASRVCASANRYSKAGSPSFSAKAMAAVSSRSASSLSSI